MKLIFLLSFLSLFFFAHSQTITPEQAKDSIGKQVTVCGTVTGTHSTDKITFLNMGGKFPDNAFTVVVFKDSADKFTYKLSTLEGAFVCITGTVKDYKGKSEIEVNNESQIDAKPMGAPKTKGNSLK